MVVVAVVADVFGVVRYSSVWLVCVCVRPITLFSFGWEFFPTNYFDLPLSDWLPTFIAEIKSDQYVGDQLRQPCLSYLLSQKWATNYNIHSKVGFKWKLSEWNAL
jgi:hypothetical protein